jgi:signal transduction histidine kinase
VHDSTGLIHAHGGFPSYIGSNTIWARDRDGKEFVREIVNVKTSQWISYKWLNPISKITEQKTVYVLRVGSFLFCSGSYSALPPE